MLWRGPIHECLSAERSSHLNVENEPRFSVYLTSHLCVVLHSLIFLIVLSFTLFHDLFVSCSK